MGYRRSAIDGIGKALHAAGVFRLLHEWALPETVSVLVYHGLIDEPLPVPEPCYLLLDRFERQMEYVASHFEVMHLEEAFQADWRRPSKPRACVTFDDGFASVHDLAFPILQRLRIPATVYLVTDFVDSDESVWFARLHQAVCQTSVSHVQVDGHQFALARPRDRAEFSADVQRTLGAVSRPSFAETLEDVLSQLGFPESRRCRPWKAFRTLSREEIRHMSREDLVRFGAHTASHQILTKTTREDARREIESSVAAVAALVERPSRSFAYPYGGSGDFDRATIEDVKRAGIDYAVTTIPGPNRSTTDPYAIRRYNIGADQSLYRFGARAHHARYAIGEVLRRTRERA